MSVRGQKIFTKVLTDDSITFIADMGITAISIELISGSGSFQGSLDVGVYASEGISLIVNSPATISSDSGLPLDGVIVDCSGGGVINILGRE